MRLLFATTALFFAACGTATGGKDDPSVGTDPDTTDTVDPGCVATIASTAPAEGATNVLPTAEITATFSSPVNDGDPFSILIPNAAGTTTLASDGLSMTWSGTLDSKATYTATFRVCADEAESTFTTAPPPIDLPSIDGATYVLRWDQVEITQPKTLPFEFDIQFLLAQMLAVNEVDQSAVALGTLGTNVGGTPEPDCDLLADQQSVDFSDNPYFEMTGTFEILVDPATNDTATLEAFQLTGFIDAGGDAIAEPALTALLATESIDFLNGLTCSALEELLDGECRPCTSSATGYCLYIEAHAETALRDPDVDVAATCGISL
jgi:Bacterial Ig-like domain